MMNFIGKTTATIGREGPVQLYRWVAETSTLDLEGEPIEAINPWPNPIAAGNYVLVTRVRPWWFRVLRLKPRWFITTAGCN